MALNRALLGKEYDPNEYDVTAEASMSYAKGYNDDNPAFLDTSRPGGIVVPPMFGVVYAGPAMVTAFFDPDLGVNFARLVHGEQDMTFLKPVRPGDKIVSQGRVAGIEDKGSGELLVTGWGCKNQNGETVVTGTSSFFIRGEKKGAGEGKEAKKEVKAEPAKAPEIVARQSMKVTDDQTYRYADASGDHNPIHVNPEFAVSVGLGGIILQGLCTMAFCSKAVMDEFLGRDPGKLKRLAVRFKKPVRPGDVITTEAWIAGKKEGLTVLNFRAKNQGGDEVIGNGIAECAV